MPKTQVENIVWMPTQELLGYSDPDNPRVHDPEGDVKQTAQSILHLGWLEIGIVFNPVLGTLVGGHGRVMGANFNRHQTEEWFEREWEIWLAANPDRKDLAEIHHERFCAAYWENCPVRVIQLDEKSHKSGLIRLNNQQVAGKDDPTRMAALLSKIPKQFNDLTGWEASTKKSFTEAFLKRVEERGGLDQSDYEPGQRFERPDATDYSVRDPEHPNDATEESGGVHSNFDSPEFPAAPEAAPGYEVVQVGTDDVNPEFRHEGVAYDSNIRETRAVLLFSREQLFEFNKKLAPACAFIVQELGYELDTVGQSIRLWRPDAFLLALRHFVEKDHAQLYAEFLESKSEPVEEEEEDGDN